MRARETDKPDMCVLLVSHAEGEGGLTTSTSGVAQMLPFFPGVTAECPFIYLARKGFRKAPKCLLLAQAGCKLSRPAFV